MSVYHYVLPQHTFCSTAVSQMTRTFSLDESSIHNNWLHFEVKDYWFLLHMGWLRWIHLLSEARVIHADFTSSLKSTLLGHLSAWNHVRLRASVFVHIKFQKEEKMWSQRVRHCCWCQMGCFENYWNGLMNGGGGKSHTFSGPCGWKRSKENGQIGISWL